MKRIVIFLILISPLISFSQEKRYRFSIDGGFHSMLFCGFKNFENVNCPQDNDVLRIYNQEVYTVKYQNFRASVNYSFGFTVNWFEREKWSLSQKFNYFKGEFNDGVQLILTDHSSDTVHHQFTTFNSTNVQTGNISNLRATEEITGVSSALIFFKRTKIKGLSIGTGIQWNGFGSYDFWWNGLDAYAKEGYRPSFSGRGSSYYSTSQLGISFNAKWSWKFLSIYFNLENAILTLKKNEKKGNFAWANKEMPFRFFPPSHNYDYRFPLTFETGISIKFDPIRKRESKELKSEI
jgi:hypothetical protein